MKALIPLIVLLAGCNTTPKMPEPPKVVRVEVVKFAPVPEELTRPCPVYEAAEQTYAEAKRLALLRLDSLLACNRDKAKIRALTP